MATGCGTWGNLGVPCGFILGDIKTVIFVPKYDKDGVVNSLANEAAVLKVTLQGKFDDAQLKDRWFPVHGFKQVEMPMAEAKKFEYNDGSTEFVRNGTYTFKAWLPKTHPYFMNKLMKFNGEDFGVFLGDSKHSFIYLTDASTITTVLPIPVDGGSLTASLAFGTPENSNYVEVTFNLKTETDFSLIRAIESADLDFDVLSGADLYSLLDVTTKKTTLVVDASDKTALLTLVDDFGTPVEGLTVGATSGFVAATAVQNVTAPADYAITSLSETAPGVYLITCSGGIGSAGNTIKVTPNKSRYNFNEGLGFTTVAIS